MKHGEKVVKSIARWHLPLGHHRIAVWHDRNWRWYHSQSCSVIAAVGRQETNGSCKCAVHPGELDGGFADSSSTGWIFIPKCDGDRRFCRWFVGSYIGSGIPSAFFAYLTGNGAVGRIIQTDLLPYEGSVSLHTGRWPEQQNGSG